MTSSEMLEVQGSGAIRIYLLNGQPVSLGRSADNDIALDDAPVSRHHARIEEADGTFRLVDLESTKGRTQGRPMLALDTVDAGEGDRVLLVDDSDDFLGVVSDWLTADPGIRIVGTARTGLEAVARVEELKPDVVVADIIMAPRDGAEVLLFHSASPGRGLDEGPVLSSARWVEPCSKKYCSSVQLGTAGGGILQGTDMMGRQFQLRRIG